MANLFTGTKITITSSIVDNRTYNELVSQEYRLPVEETSYQAVKRHIDNFLFEYDGAVFEVAASNENELYVSGDRRMHSFLADRFEYKNYIVSIEYGSMSKKGMWKTSKNQ